MKTRNALGLTLLTLLLAAHANAETTRPFDPVGRWRFYHTDGQPFLASLLPDQSASTDWAGGERGIWRWEGNSVRILYTDGWDDLLTLSSDGKFVKSGWSPEANRCAAASNQAAAEHLSSDPGTGVDPTR
jgi:hypothetical protein